MDMKIRPLLAEEQKYTYKQSSQLTSQTGSIGYLRGDFDRDGTGFYSTWFDEVESRKSDVFKGELDKVINALRFDAQYGPVLAGRKEMRDYVRGHLDSAFQGNCTTEYGFRIDTADYAYLLRCNPQKGDYNFYCYCFESKWLDRHLQNARNSIRFITPDYKEKFRIPDGDKIRIKHSDGELQDLTCRFIDDYHLEVGSGLYHICQFAEIMERNGSTVIPLRSSLPEQCYSTLAGTGEVIVIRKGESGYYKSELDTGDRAKNTALVEKYNQKLGVTKAQEDWREFLESEYPDLSEDERLALMYEMNGDYLDDERSNLNIQLTQPIIVIGDLGLWYGRRMGYKEIESGNIRDCLYSDTDYSTWYVDKLGDLRCDAVHHDGTNHYLYRTYKDGVRESQIDLLKEKLYRGTATHADITRVTRRLGDEIAQVYGFSIPRQRQTATMER